MHAYTRTLTQTHSLTPTTTHSMGSQPRRWFAQNMLSALTEGDKPVGTDRASVGPNHQNQPKEEDEVSECVCVHACMVCVYVS
jgi:hypothetical protein